MCYWQILYVLIKNDREVKVTYSLDEFRQRMKGVVFANPI